METADSTETTFASLWHLYIPNLEFKGAGKSFTNNSLGMSGETPDMATREEGTDENSTTTLVVTDQDP